MGIRRVLARVTVVLAVGASTLLDVSAAGAIVGGVATSPSDHPYFARVISPISASEVVLCGGSVVDPEWVLTAAHCVAGTTESEVVLSDGSDTRAAQRVVHPLWNGRAEDGHDLALLRIPRTTVAPVQVGDPADAGSYAADRPATMVGRGRTTGGRPPDGSLRVVAVPLRSDTAMRALYPWNEALTIGAGSPTHTICNGDSGGPLTVTNRGRRIQVGVASFITAEGCDQPAGYAELSGAQLAWVAVHVPSQQGRWGPCSVGRWRVQYTQNPERWTVACVRAV